MLQTLGRIHHIIQHNVTSPSPPLYTQGSLFKRKMRAWYLSNTEQECSSAILEELGCGVNSKAAEKLGVVDESELSPDHLGQAFADTVKVI